MLFNVSAYSQGFESYLELHEKLDSLRAEEHFEEAAIVCDSLFEKYEFLITREEYVIAAGLNVMAGKTALAYELLEKVVFNNFDRYTDYDALTTNLYLMPLFSDERWSLILDRVQENYRIVSNKSNAKMKDELEQIYAIYQGERSYIYPYSEAYGEDSKEFKLLQDSMAYHDSINQIRVVKFIDSNGILGADEVGAQGNLWLFLALNVSDTTCRINYLPVIEEAFLKERIKPRTYARFIDILLIDRGQKQLYGTLVESSESGDFRGFQPIQDPEKVEERRAELGLIPMKRYARFLGLKWDL